MVQEVEGATGDALEIVATFEQVDAARFGLLVRSSTDGKASVPVWFDARSGEFGIADVRAPSDLAPEKPVRMQVFVDRSVVEVYLNGNALTKITYLDPCAQEVAAFAEGGSCTLASATVWEMNSMWPLE